MICRQNTAQSEYQDWLTSRSLQVKFSEGNNKLNRSLDASVNTCKLRARIIYWTKWPAARCNSCASAQAEYYIAVPGAKLEWIPKKLERERGIKL